MIFGIQPACMCGCTFGVIRRDAVRCARCGAFQYAAPPAKTDAPEDEAEQGSLW